MNETKQQSISERMAARVSEAEAKIKALLWGGGDADEVAGVALAGGIDPARVDRLATEIGNAKATLAAAEAAHKALPGITKGATEARTAAAKTSAALAKASTADDEAQQALGDAEAAVAQAENARRTALNAALSGKLPADAWPAWLRTLAAEAVAADERQKAVSKAAGLRHAIRRCRDSVAYLEKEAERLAKSKNRERECVVTGGGLQDSAEAFAARLKTERAALAVAETELAKLEAITT
jgi:hypothetical protein